MCVWERRRAETEYKRLKEMQKQIISKRDERGTGLAFPSLLPCVPFSWAICHPALPVLCLASSSVFTLGHKARLAACNTVCAHQLKPHTNTEHKCGASPPAQWKKTSKGNTAGGFWSVPTGKEAAHCGCLIVEKQRQHFFLSFFFSLSLSIVPFHCPAEMATSC